LEDKDHIDVNQERSINELLAEQWSPDQLEEIEELAKNLSENFKIQPKVVKAILYSKTKNAPKTSDVGDEINSLEDMVQEALGDLTGIDDNLLDIISPSGKITSESKSLMLVRRFQNSMKKSLADGIGNKNMEIFLEAFDFFDSAIDILTSTGNLSEIDQAKTELINDLKKILDHLDNDDPSLRPFAFKICRVLAEIYDSFEQYSSALLFHNRAGNLQENDLVAHLEYIQVALDYVLIEEVEDAKEYIANMRLTSIKTLGNQLLEAINEKNLDMIDKIKTRIKEMGLKRSVDTKNTLILIDTLTTALKGVEKTSGLEKVQIPQKAGKLSTDKLDAVMKSIKQLQAAKPSSAQIPTAQLDTQGIISELKSAFSSEISKEIKSLSQDIIVKLLSKLPSGGFGSAAPLRSAGHISDAGRPEIEIVGNVPGERPKRPKLDDMLDSIVVSE